MEIAFTVTKLGPLSQIAVPIIGIDKLVYLAYHAYGWYKSTEQALTLEQTLGSNGASLVATSAFNLRRYCNIRQDQGGVYGAAQGINGSLTRILLPKASTATEGNSGLICLRALVIGLLCFVRQPYITSILKEVLPHYLLNHELEGDVTELQGACVAAVSQYVTTISKEEDIDILSGRLQDHIDSQLKRVTDATLFELQSSQKMDISQVTGLLRWILTPLHSRQSSTYPTKSAKVWALALVLSEVGFEIEARRKAITTAYSAERHDAAMPGDYRDIPEVVLVLSPGWHTDIGTRTPMSIGNVDIRPPPRIIPIRAVPTVAFSELIIKMPYLNPITLETAFFATFAHVQRCLRARPWFCLAAGFQDCLKPIEQDRDVFDCLGAQYRDLLVHYTSNGSLERFGATNEEMMRLLSPMIEQYAARDEDVREECIYVFMQHIVLAGTLAMVTLFIHRDGTDSESALDIDFVYDAPFSNDINDRRWPQQDWAKRVGADLWTMKGLFEPNNSDYHSAYAFAPSDENALRRRRQVTHKYFSCDWANDMAKILVGATLTPETSVFGAQNHGLAIVSSFALQPSMSTSAPFIYHMQRGQLLDIPTKGGLILDGLKETPLHCKRRTLDSSFRVRAVEDLDEKPVEISSLRWDLDPCWETDVQSCCVNLRVGGLPVLQLSLHALLRSLEISYADRAPCPFTTSDDSSSCQNRHPEDAIARTKNLVSIGTWFRLPLLEMLRQGEFGISDIEGESSDETKQPNWVINAHDSEILAILALNCTFTSSLKPQHRILAECLLTGMEKAESLGYPKESVMIILHNLGSRFQSELK
ncbi:MAG: hypothetical protein M1812_002931 [Candelaria pacifica]|nr:MAG: hypothetical protein M1812_002931 [Candelaria pacifica]